MDSAQAKMVELSDNLCAIEVCLLSGELKYDDVVIYLQYDIPFDEQSEIYTKLKRSFDNGLNEQNRMTDGERREALTSILTKTQQCINDSNVNNGHIDKVFKGAYDMAEEIKTLLKNPNCFKQTATIEPFFRKAAV